MLSVVETVSIRFRKLYRADNDPWLIAGVTTEVVRAPANTGRSMWYQLLLQVSADSHLPDVCPYIYVIHIRRLAKLLARTGFWLEVYVRLPPYLHMNYDFSEY